MLYIAPKDCLEPLVPEGNLFVFRDRHVFVAVRTANIAVVFIVNDEIPPATWAFEFK